MSSSVVRTVPIGTFALLLLAAGLEAALLIDVTSPSAGGEAAFSDAFGSLLLLAALWAVLVLLLLVAGIVGNMPKIAAIASVPIIPVAFAASVVAVDAVSRRQGWGLVALTLLPVLIAFYAAWTRLPRLRASLPARPTAITVWSAVAIISAGTLILASIF